MKRAFISINLPNEVKEKVKKIQEKIPEFRGKKTEPENLHLTLKFLGEISDEKIGLVRDKLKKIKGKKISAEIDSIGFFSPKFLRIIWVHMKGADELQKQIDISLADLFEKEKRFMSHITIARVKQTEDKKKFISYLEKIELEKTKFNVENFYLMESTLKKEGSEYKIIEEFNLN